jgi:Sec-independent protein translocase protein TatA
MPWGLSPIHVAIALAIILFIVGPGRLPGIGSLVGRRVREFGHAANDTKGAFLSEVQVPDHDAGSPDDDLTAA